MAYPERRALCRSPITNVQAYAHASVLKEQRPDQPKQSFRANGLCDKIGPRRQIPGCGGHTSGCDHHTNILSIIAHSAGQLEAIDAPAWHFHVRDDHLDFGNGRKNMRASSA